MNYVFYVNKASKIYGKHFQPSRIFESNACCSNWQNLLPQTRLIESKLYHLYYIGIKRLARFKHLNSHVRLPRKKENIHINDNSPRNWKKTQTTRICLLLWNLNFILILCFHKCLCQSIINSKAYNFCLMNEIKKVFNCLLKASIENVSLWMLELFCFFCTHSKLHINFQNASLKYLELVKFLKGTKN